MASPAESDSALSEALTTSAQALGTGLANLLRESSDDPVVSEVMRQWAVAVLAAGQLMLDRQRKYGCANIAGFMERGVVVRASDKLGRLRHAYFSDGSTDTPDESLEDTWLDLLNYGAIGRTCHTGGWPRA